MTGQSDYEQKREAVARVWNEVSGKARAWAGNYPQSSDGQNTFIMFAEWAETRALATTGEPS